MKTISLTDYLKTRTKTELALAIGVTPSAVSQMVSANRRIELTLHDDGRIEANEIRPIGKRSVAA